MNSGSVHKIARLILGVSGLLALLLAYLYPFHLTPWTTFYNEWSSAIFLGCAWAWVISHSQISLTSPWPWLGGLLLVVLHTAASGAPVAVQSTLGGVFVVYGLLGWLAYALGLNLRATWWLDAVLGVVWLAAMVSAVIAVLQWSGVVSGADWGPGFILYAEGGGRVSSNIGQANNLGTLLVLGLGVVGYGWYRAPSPSLLARGVGLLGVLVLVLGIYLSGSRTALLNLVLWPALFFVWARWNRQPLPWLVWLPVGLLLVFYVFLPPVQEARSLVSDSGRLRLWAMVFSEVMASPWWGHGFGAVAHAHLRSAPEFGAIDYTIAQHAHNTVLDMWAIFGVPLGTLLVAGVSWLWWRAWLACQAAKDQFVWLMATAMLVHGMLEYPLHYGFFLWLLFVLLGVLGGRPWKVAHFSRPLPVALGWLALYMAAAVPVWSAYVPLEWMYTLYRQQGPEATHQALASPDLAVNLALSRTLYAEPYERLRWVAAPIDDVLTLSDADFRALEQLALRQPLPALALRVALAHAARGDGAQAAWWAERICRMFDPRVCASAAAEWQRRAADHPQWPVLPWGQWLPKEGGQ